MDERSSGLVRSQTTGRRYCNDSGHGCNCPGRPELVSNEKGQNHGQLSQSDHGKYHLAGYMDVRVWWGGS